jgi:hypothetical protein
MNSKDKNIDKIHKNELGLNVPDDYFLKSKNNILAKTIAKKEPKIISIFSNKFLWVAAAGIALIFVLTVYKQQVMPSVKNTPEIVLDTVNFNENFDLALHNFNDENVLVESLFISDENVENYVTTVFLEEVIADEYLDDFIVNELMEEELF